MKRKSSILAMLFVATIAGAQTINLHMKNGEVIKYNSSEVDYIDFTESSEPEAYTACPDNHHPHLIDLGLPSGTKWACCNVGASSPEQYGNYYAWGETSPKSYYGPSTYQFSYLDDSGDYDPRTEKSYRYSNIGSDIAGTGYDAATANWGSPWRMPSFEQCNELRNNCTYVWTTQNGVNGMKFTGPSGGTIFLPAAGNRWYDDLNFAGDCGYYWSSSFGESYSYYAWGLYFDSGSVNMWHFYRNYRVGGQGVRPVRKN